MTRIQSYNCVVNLFIQTHKSCFVHRFKKKQLLPPLSAVCSSFYVTYKRIPIVISLLALSCTSIFLVILVCFCLPKEQNTAGRASILSKTYVLSVSYLWDYAFISDKLYKACISQRRISHTSVLSNRIQDCHV